MHFGLAATAGEFYTEFKQGAKIDLSDSPMLYYLPNDKIWESPKFKAFADDNFNMAKMVKFVFDGIENIVEKGENAGC